jgi:hypothetical protein
MALPYTDESGFNADFFSKMRMSCLWQRGFQSFKGKAIRKFQGNFNPYLNPLKSALLRVAINRIRVPIALVIKLLNK